MGYTPFFLNSGRMPRTFIWNNPSKDEYPSVRVFAQRMKHTIMDAHDTILEARVKQTRAANRKQQISPFKIRDLMYVSTKNMSLPKGHTRKLAPKYIGPYEIISDYGNNSYKLDLPGRLRRRGIHPVFHASLLRIHVPNNDRLFPGRLETQVADFGKNDTEWQVDCLLSHVGSGPTGTLEVQWMSGDITWIPYEQLAHLSALCEYLDLLDIDKITDLPTGNGEPLSNDAHLNCGTCLIVPDRPFHMQPYHSRNDTRPWRAPRFNYERIFRDGNDFIFRVNEPFCSTVLVPRTHLRLCLDFSIRIRIEMRAANLPPAPIGYNTIAHVFNSEPSNPHHLSVLRDDGRWLPSDYPEPPPSLFFGINAPEAATNAANPHINEMGEMLFECELWRNRKIKAERETRGKA